MTDSTVQPGEVGGGHCVRAFLGEVFQEDGELEFQKMVASPD